MFEDFLNLNYWKIDNKLSKIRELINRLNIEYVFDELNSITEKMNRMEPSIQNMGDRLRERVEPEEEELLPDLIISEIVPIERDHYIDFKITVKNQGKFVSEACSLSVKVANNEDVALSIPSLEIDETVTLYHQYSFDPNSIIPKGGKTILATADSTYIIKESNEINNTRSCQFQTLEQEAGLIVHLHNPEGKEIGSIDGTSGIILSHGIIPINESTHGIPTLLSPGNYNISTSFNGITLNQNISIETGETKEIFFTFPRTNMNLIESVNMEIVKSLAYGEIVWDYTHWTSKMTGGADESYGKIKYDIILNSLDFISTFYAKLSARKATCQCLLTENWNDITNPISIYVPIRSDFNQWIVQSLQTGQYPSVSLGTTENPGDIYQIVTGRIPTGAEPKYEYKKINTNLSYTKLGFFWTNPMIALFVNSAPYEEMKSDTRLGQLTPFRISSIPYDILGTAV